MSDKCPFCGAEKYTFANIADRKFKCGTLDNDSLPHRLQCWRAWALSMQAQLETMRDKLLTIIPIVSPYTQADALCGMIPK
jgi:hypothetical protein